MVLPGKLGGRVGRRRDSSRSAAIVRRFVVSGVRVPPGSGKMRHVEDNPSRPDPRAPRGPPAPPATRPTEPTARPGPPDRTKRTGRMDPTDRVAVPRTPGATLPTEVAEPPGGTPPAGGTPPSGGTPPAGATPPPGAGPPADRGAVPGPTGAALPSGLV